MVKKYKNINLMVVWTNFKIFNNNNSLPSYQAYIVCGHYVE